MSKLDSISVQFIKGVGPAKKKLFANLGVENIEDLFYLFPRRYEDRTNLTPIPMLKVGEFQTVSGKVVTRSARRSWYTKKHVSETIIDDGKGRIVCVWFNQPYLERYFKAGAEVILYGKVDVYKNRLQMVSPEYEMIDNDEDKSLHLGRIVPIYPSTKGMTQRYLRRVIKSAMDKYLNDMEDILPVYLRNKYRFPNIKRSLQNIHFPEKHELMEEAMRRISFEEFFLFQISVIKRRMSIVNKSGVMHKIDLDMVNRYASLFPFELTSAQSKVIREIAGDMQKPSPMLRLLQGDVGSGKTAVALFGCVAAFKNGHQAAILAPTEILARQHYQNIQEILKEGPYSPMKTALLISGLKKGERESIVQGLKEGGIDLVIGTHALLSEGVDFKNLSFVVIDEQHKFGVRQRSIISEKGSNPDVLIMTATPIPRTLSLTLYGDLDVSVIDEIPKGRGKVTTELFGHEEAMGVYKRIIEYIKKGQQAFIVYPIIEESEKLDLKAAQTMYVSFQKKIFKEFKVGLIHGQMKRSDMDSMMEQFKNHELDILVATTVLEVGVDVPNANVMVIEHAERFGLSQLHQLRGRIGRGKEDAVCFLIAEAVTDDAQARLKAVLKTTDGFKIAESDLLIRGPGHYFGRHQHGLNELRFANPVTQIHILELARHEAKDLVHQDPELESGNNRILKTIIQERYPGYLKMVTAG